MLWLAALLLTASAAYLPAAWQAGYVHDDAAAVTAHPQVQWPVDWPQLVRARYFGGPEFAYVFAARPLATLSFAAEIGLGLDSPQGRHLGQFLLLIGVSVLAGLLVRRWQLARGQPEQQAELAAGLAALLFAVHPVHTEAVMAIAYRPELLAALALLAGTHHLLSLATGSASRIGHSLGLCLWGLAALLSKESALAGLVWWALWAIANRQTWQRLRLTWLPIGAALAAWLAWRLWAVGALLKAQVPRHDNPLAYVEWPQRLLGGLDLTGRAMGQLLAPVHLAPDYTFDAWPTPTALTAFGAVGLAALVAAVAWVKLHWLRHWLRRTPDNPLSPQAILPHGGWLLLAGALGCWLPVSHLLTPGTVLYADRLLTLPSLLLAVAVAVQLSRWRLRWSAGAAALLTLAGIWQTRAVAEDWRSPLLLFERGVRLEPRSLRMRLNLAHELTVLSLPRQALPHAQAALALDPSDPKTWVNGLDAALGAKDCAAAEDFVQPLSSSTKRAVAARLAAVEWGMACAQYQRAFGIAARLPAAALTGRRPLDVYVLAVAAGSADAASWAQRFGVDPAADPRWLSAQAFAEQKAGRPVEAVATLHKLYLRQPAQPAPLKLALGIFGTLVDPSQRARLLELWPELKAAVAAEPAASPP